MTTPSNNRASHHLSPLAELVGAEQAQKVIDFSQIINPYYPTPAMKQQLTARLAQPGKGKLSGDPRVGAAHLAEVLHVSAGNLIVANGATELISTICSYLIDSICVPVPAITDYLDKIESHQIVPYRLDPSQDYRLDLEDYLEWLRHHEVHAALLLNPLNPTGQTFSREEMHTFVRRATWLDLIVVDETFVDFSGEQTPTLLHSADLFSNMMIIHSLSKLSGMPELHLGFSYTDNRYLLNRLRRALPSWHINALADYYLSLLPSTDAAYHQARRRLIKDVEWLSQALQAVPGFRVYPTGANFMLLRVENGRTAHDIQTTLLHDYNLYVLDCSHVAGMDAYHIRVTSQGRKNDQRLVQALTELSELNDR